MPGERQYPDDGFGLVEVIVSIMLISIVLAALTTFFVSSIRVIRVQDGRQTAVQLATEAVERVRAQEPATLVRGRDQQSVDAQFASPVAGVDLSGTQKIHDTNAVSGAGASATLPTTYRTVTLDGIAYRQYWYLGACSQPKGGGDCTAVSGYATLYRVIVAVTWTDAACTGTCTYLASTLISSESTDPLFNLSGP